MVYVLQDAIANEKTNLRCGCREANRTGGNSIGDMKTMKTMKTGRNFFVFVSSHAPWGRRDVHVPLGCVVNNQVQSRLSRVQTHLLGLRLKDEWWRVDERSKVGGKMKSP